MAKGQQQQRGCIERVFEGIGCVVGLIGGAVYGYFQDPTSPVINAILYGGVFGIMGGIIGRLAPTLIIVGVIAFIIAIIKKIQG
ncbi:MAG: hypothetical protein JNM99_08180 [Verrucomicrobiaceae bacterium]|nr:hypothetical protein [Verrucomicrobiaceae bacterium]